MTDNDKPKHENRGRSDEAHDPDRPIDPLTGEKEGLGPRDDKPVKPEEDETEVEPEAE